MAVSVYFGLTESGKSYHVQNHVIPAWKRVVIFDNAHCFKGDVVVTEPNEAQFTALLNRFKGVQNFVIVIRPGRNGSTLVLFNRTVALAVALGRLLGLGRPDPRVDPAERIQMITDEADFVCSTSFQSLQLKHLVNKGRHDNVDSHFIARMPARIHTDIRVNSSKIVTFRLQNSSEIPLFLENFGREITAKVRVLPKYWRLEWRDNGTVNVFNEKNKIVENFLEKSQENSRKRAA